ncbi:uncharacterized protein PHALS_00995 [Plasmopara halstedii]|uniref:Uncharacterized protein n=1 Tax=Plasmopara halstedii TaxID=4781 RepID=A0A0P1ASY5_PLAHL|nr:uncharacterized protein PHALS_00995 [Plasmopara halstedii]CEG44649.1 hypothetical protein PHALS_00995 [Plasmopara halstedii]|eukprot:XP_024581018.1 hypothetical protein PHALS_00995 [Plasmopara halstedii]
MGRIPCVHIAQFAQSSEDQVVLNRRQEFMLALRHAVDKLLSLNALKQTKYAAVKNLTHTTLVCVHKVITYSDVDDLEKTSEWAPRKDAKDAVKDNSFQK